MADKNLSIVYQQLKEEKLADAKRKRHNLELLAIRAPTSIDEIRSYVPPPKNPLPCNALPEWCDLRLDQKFPAVPAPNGTFITSVGDLADNIFIKTTADFDLSDPFIHDTPIEYDALHDPNLKDYFQMNPLVCQRLIDLGLLNCEGKVICTLPEFNKYRKYLSRIQNKEIMKEHERIETWQQQEHKTLKMLLRFLERTVKDKIEKERKIRMEAKRQAIEAENRERKQRALKHPSNFIKERRILEARIRKAKREAMRCRVLDRIRRVRDAERRRARHLILEWICRDEFRQKLRRVDQIEKRINRQEDLCEFIESKRIYQEQKRRQRIALLKRNKMEKDCLKQKYFEHNMDRLLNDPQKQLEAQQRKRDKAAHRLYLIEKYGRRWLEMTRKDRDDPMHQSTWNIRNVLHSMVQHVKHESGVIDFTDFIYDILKLKKMEVHPETKAAVDYILKTLLDKSFKIYMKRMTSCFVDIIMDKTRKQLNNACQDAYPDPSDFDDPKLPKRRREKLTLSKPSYPCTGPCAQFGRAHDPNWSNNCVDELQWIRDELCLKLTNKLVDQIRRSKGSCLARLEDRARNTKCGPVCNPARNLPCVPARRARKRKYFCKDLKFLDRPCNDDEQVVSPPMPQKKTPPRKKKAVKAQGSIPPRPRQTTGKGGPSSAHTTDSEADAVPISPGIATSSGPDKQQSGPPVRPKPVKQTGTGGPSKVGTGTQVKPSNKPAAVGVTTPRKTQGTEKPPQSSTGVSTDTDTLQPTEDAAVGGQPPKEVKETSTEPKAGQDIETTTDQKPPEEKRVGPIPSPAATAGTSPEPKKVTNKVVKATPPVQDKGTVNEPKPTKSTAPPKKRKSEVPTATEPSVDQGVGEPKPAGTDAGTDRQPQNEVATTAPPPPSTEDSTGPEPKEDKGVTKKPDTEEKTITAEPSTEDKQVTNDPPKTQDRGVSEDPKPEAATQEGVPQEESKVGPEPSVDRETQKVVPETDQESGPQPPVDRETQEAVPESDQESGPEPPVDSETQEAVPESDQDSGPQPPVDRETQEAVPETDQESGPQPPVDSETQETVPESDQESGPQPPVDRETQEAVPETDQESGPEPPVDSETQEAVPETDQESGPQPPVDSETEPIPVPVEDKSVSDEPKTDSATHRKPSQEDSGVGPPDTFENSTDTTPTDTEDHESSQEPTTDQSIDTEPRPVTENTDGPKELVEEETERVPGQDDGTQKEPEPFEDQETQEIVDTHDVCIDPETGEDICVGYKQEPETEDSGVGPPTTSICDEDRICGPDPWDNAEIEPGNLTRAVSSSVNTVLEEMQKCLIKKCIESRSNKPCPRDTQTNPCVPRTASTHRDCISAGLSPSFLEQMSDPRERCVALLAGQMREFCLDLSPEELQAPDGHHTEEPGSSAKTGTQKPSKTILNRAMRQAALPPRDSDSDLSRTASEFVRQIVQQERTRLIQDCVDGSGDDYKGVGTTISTEKLSPTSSELVHTALMSTAMERATRCIEENVGTALAEVHCPPSSVVSQCVHEKLEHIKKMLAEIKSDLASIGIRSCKCDPETDLCKPP